MNNNAAAIYGGGYDSDVTGDIFIHIKENSLISEETVWGGGTGDSTITGGVTITVDDSSEVIGEIRAGGNEGAERDRRCRNHSIRWPPIRLPDHFCDR